MDNSAIFSEWERHFEDEHEDEYEWEHSPNCRCKECDPDAFLEQFMEYED